MGEAKRRRDREPCARCGRPRSEHGGRSKHDGGPGICPGTSTFRFEEPKPVAQPEPRSCGGCTACCEVLTIGPPLNKPAGVRCQHAQAGCTIYASRPSPCQQFRCGWHLGYGEDSDRPDQIGMMLHAVPVPPGTVFADMGIEMGLQAIELPSGASRRGIDLVRIIAETYPITVLHKDGTRRLVGPPDVLERVQKLMQEKGVVGWREN